MKKKKGVIILILVLAVLAIAGYVARNIIFEDIRARLEAEINKLRDSGYFAKYDSISIDVASGTVEVYGLSVSKELDSARCVRSDLLATPHIKATGFSIFQLIMRKQLRFETIEVDSTHLVFHENFFKKDAANPSAKEFTIRVGRLRLPALRIEIYNSTDCKPASSYTLQAAATNVVLAFYSDRPVYFNLEKFSAEDITAQLPRQLYTLKVREATLNLKLGLFDLDTLRIIPHYDRAAFGRRMGREIDRIEGIVPYVNVYGLSINHLDSLAIEATRVTTHFFVKVFRDKRLPFKNDIRLLPMEALEQLPVQVKIPELIINKSFVQYEEFDTDADSAGYVFFDDLFATIRDISNHVPDRGGVTALNARASLMGHGEVRLKATFPRNPAREHHVSGSIADFDMRHVNSMLEPIIQVRAESGRLNHMSFEFSGDSYHSKGTVSLNYNDLRLTTFKDESRINKLKRRKKNHEGDDEEVNRKAALKTFVVNTFIIRRDMDRHVPEQKRTGSIDFERNRRKAIFNYWWKSALSGIKSAYNLDKLEDSRLKKMLQKKEKD